MLMLSTNSHKNPWIAAALSSVLFPPLTWLYLGQPKRAMLWVLIAAFAVSFDFAPTLELYFAWIGLAFCLYLTSAIWGYRWAKHNVYQPSRWNRWWGYPLIFLVATPAIGLPYLVTGSETPRWQSYRYVSAALVPLIERGQRVLVDRFAYEDGNQPERGEIVFHSYYNPETSEEETRILMVAAGPGDHLKIEGEQIEVNGQAIEGLFLDEALRPLPFSKEGTMGAATYWLLGINLRVSKDSRVIGAVSQDHIKGKVVAAYSFWPPSFKRID